MTSTIVLRLRRLGWTIAFTDCPDVVAGLEAILDGWKLLRDQRFDPAGADASIARKGDCYSWRSAILPRPKQWDNTQARTTMNIVSDVHDVLFDWFLLRFPKRSCLHTAAIEIGGGLVCFPSIGKAGKSTLSAELVAAGHRLYCDDVLPLEPRSLRGMALGISPLLRRPVPRQARARVSALVRERRGLSGPKWMYLRLAANEIAPFGETARICGLVLLAREKRRRTALVPVRPAEMLKEMVLQNFGSRGDAALALDCLHRAVQQAACYRLTYSNVRDAADCIEAAFPAIRSP